MRARLVAAGVDSVEAVHRWLEIESRLSGTVLNQLAALLPPSDRRTYGAYDCLAHLADGGMGSVWLAAAPDRRLVVIKTMRDTPGSAVEEVRVEPDGSIWIDQAAMPATTRATPTARRGGSEGSDLQRRFEREARITRGLDHPNVVRCLDHGIAADGTRFMVLEFIRDGDLKELVLGRGPLPEVEALGLLHQVAEGLVAAHAVELIHRDIKPHNIFVTDAGVAKLADFGFARSTQMDRTFLTMAGTTVGSPAYMSPEQVAPDCELDIRSDLYALGAVLYFCLVGHPPYAGSIPEVLHQHRTAAVPDARLARPELSPATAAIIARCMHKDRDQRYADPRALCDALATAAAALPREQRPQASAESSTVSMDLSPEAIMRALASGDEPRAPAAQDREGQIQQPAPAKERTVHGRLPSEAALQSALSWEWLALVPIANDDGSLILLYARTRLCLGKHKDAAVDICLRNYPVPEHMTACQRLSRQHLVLGLDDNGRCHAQDLGSANGTTINGAPARSGQTIALTVGQDHLIELARTVTLRVRPIPRAPTGERLDGDGPVDALVLTRPKNRPTLAYALVARRLSIGGAGAD
ncbi:MAG: protein kinase, partial [Planctomycetes bacterium]|nr:protein kinase [Planctomycetota bacterium]